MLCKSNPKVISLCGSLNLVPVRFSSLTIRPQLTLLETYNEAMWSYLYACMLSSFSRIRLIATLWTIAHQAPLSMGFSRQEYWSGCHALLQIFPTQGLNPHFYVSHIGRWILYYLLAPPGKPTYFFPLNLNVCSLYLVYPSLHLHPFNALGSTWKKEKKFYFFPRFSSSSYFLQKPFHLLKT